MLIAEAESEALVQAFCPLVCELIWNPLDCRRFLLSKDDRFPRWESVLTGDEEWDLFLRINGGKRNATVGNFNGYFWHLRNRCCCHVAHKRFALLVHVL